MLATLKSKTHIMAIMPKRAFHAILGRLDKKGWWLSRRILASSPEFSGLAETARLAQKNQGEPYQKDTFLRKMLWFLPPCRLYAVCILLAGMFALGLLFLSDQDKIIGTFRSSVLLQASIVILGVAIPVVTSYTGIRTFGELVISYLWDVTRVTSFAWCTGIAVLSSLSAWLIGQGLADNSAIGYAVFLIVGILGLGLTLGTVLMLMRILLEVIQVSSKPSFGLAAGAWHHAAKLVAIPADFYRKRLFLNGHREKLDKAENPAWDEQAKFDTWQAALRRHVTKIVSEYDWVDFEKTVEIVIDVWTRLFEKASIREAGTHFALQGKSLYRQLLDTALRTKPVSSMSWADQVYDFVFVLQRQFIRRFREAMLAENKGLFELYLEQIPDLYARVCRWCKENALEGGVDFVWRLRAWWGSDLKGWGRNLAPDYFESLAPKQNARYLYAVHRHCMAWLDKAVDLKDGDCAVSLSEILKYVFDESLKSADALHQVDIDDVPSTQLLLIRHLALVGKFIKKAKATDDVSVGILKILCKNQSPLEVDALVCILTFNALKITHLLEDFEDRSDWRVMHHDPLHGVTRSSRNSTSLLQRDYLFLGGTLFLLESLCRIQPEDYPKGLPRSFVKLFEKAVGTLEKKKSLLSKSGCILSDITIHKFLEHLHRRI